jgi:hypothetical protein
MDLFERDDVNTISGPCKSCSKTTRSHVLQKALYEEYITEVVIEASDEYANKQWEETEEIVKMRKAKEAVVVCHVCWLKRREEVQKIIVKDYEKWEKNPLTYVSRIHVVAEVCNTYDFDTESNKMGSLISKLKESAVQ